MEESASRIIDAHLNRAAEAARILEDQTRVKYNQIGRTGLDVSIIGLGMEHLQVTSMEHLQVTSMEHLQVTSMEHLQVTSPENILRVVHNYAG